MRRLWILFVVPVLLVFMAFSVRYLLLDRAKVVSLDQNQLYSKVDQTIRSVSQNSYQPILGKDYEISDTEELGEGLWVVVSITPIKNGPGPAVIAFEKKGNEYVKILGPGSYFSEEDLSNVPTYVAEYVNRKK